MNYKDIDSPKAVRAAVKRIKKVGEDDDESAHSYEDELYRFVLRRSAEMHPEAAKMADEALKSQGLPFSRWCA